MELLNNIGNILGAGATGLDVTYSTVLARMTALGYALPSAGQQAKQSTLRVALETAGFWTNADLFYLFATDGDSDAATINWITPASFQATKVSSIGFLANNGFKGNGTTQYLDTNWAAGTNAVKYLQDSASMFMAILENIDEAKNDFGAGGSVSGPNFGNTRLLANTGTIHRLSVNENNGTSTSKGAAVSSLGFFQIQRKASNDFRLFKNGVQVDTTGASASSTLSTRNMLVGSFNVDGVPTTFNTKRMACFGVGSAMSGNELALYNAWNTYFTSIP